MPRKPAVKAKQAPTPTTVGHGCVDCLSYQTPMQKQPCKGCKSWSNWTPSEKYTARMEERARIEAEISKKAARWLKGEGK